MVIFLHNLRLLFLNKRIFSGHYMLFNASSTDSINSIARLSSPLQSGSNGPSCLEFYYNANGNLVLD